MNHINSSLCTKRHICRSDCNAGCVRKVNCNLCADEACEDCSSFESGCSRCIDFAFKEEGLCHCDGGHLYVPRDHKCVGNCYQGCKECTDSTIHGCLICESGYYILKDSVFDLYSKPSQQCV